jgi:hypothetical protein
MSPTLFHILTNILDKMSKTPPNHERDEGNYFFVRKI